jgi:MFS transporter, DHA2 family, multidrug resistance protein
VNAPPATTAGRTARSAVSNRALITVSIMLATVMQALDTTIANVALPHIQGSMSATQDQISWVLTSYIVAAAIATPLTGFMAARFGRKRIFAVAVAGFVLSSMLCGAATSLEQIIAFRMLQGVFGAGLVPLSQSVLLDTYPKEKHGQAMALWGIGVMVGPILGPTLGGYLTADFSWRWVFYINLPFGLLALLGILSFVRETPIESARKFDVFGFTLLAIAIGALQFMLDRGQSQDWFNSREIVIECVLFLLGLYMFLVHITTSRTPFIEPALFMDRNFSLGLVMIFVVGIILLATLALLPPFLEGLSGFPVLLTGYVLAPRGIGTMVAMFIVGRLIGRVDARFLIILGLILIAGSLLQMTRFTSQVPVSLIVQTGIVQGLGLGFVFVPLSTIAFSTLAPRFRTEGASMYSLMRNIGSSIGISIVVTLLARNTQINHAALAEAAHPFNLGLQWLGSGAAWNLSTTTGLVTLNSAITAQAETNAYLDDFMLMAVITAATIPLVLFFRPLARTSGTTAPVVHLD